MSAALPQSISPNNPIDDQAVIDTLADLGVKIPENEVPEYADFLKGAWEIWNKIDGADDYIPTVDLERFPREQVHRPSKEENPTNGWAWKVTIEDKQGKGGLLAGKTVCLKDNVAVKDVPAMLGTDFFGDWTPNTDATIVTRILEAGGKVLGKAMCENMSLWGASGSASTGPIHNARAHGYSAGGSSSGTGVLVASGAVDMGIGGDQGGSIRLPASKNGIVGLKPTHGLVPYTGIASFEATLDHTGPMTRTVLDNALFLQAIAGADGIDDRQGAGCPFPDNVPDYPALAKKGVEGLKIGLLTEGFNCPMHDKRVSEAVEKAAQRLTLLGATVEHVSMPTHSEGPNLWVIIGRMSATVSWGGKACGRHQLYMNDLTLKTVPMTQEKFDHLFTSGVNTFVNGEYAWKHMSPTLLGKAYNLVRKLRDEYNAVLTKYDVLVMPTIPFLAPRLADPGSGPTELMKSATGLTSNTSPFNLTGLPALSLPIGNLPSMDNSAVQLPVGMQIVSKAFREDLVYRVAYASEQQCVKSLKA
ncbi:hypothetical protein CspHIS471_0603640 [Cutaneotrichosporon sp. HIS471]|nr:hypothetical protein CspHIS471_0603640 [Cutaneotrichosporon sp. HIS471]